MSVAVRGDQHVETILLKYHVSSVTFLPDGKTMLVPRNALSDTAHKVAEAFIKHVLVSCGISTR